jgi:hypothetical protein
MMRRQVPRPWQDTLLEHLQGSIIFDALPPMWARPPTFTAAVDGRADLDEELADEMNGDVGGDRDDGEDARMEGRAA